MEGWQLDPSLDSSLGDILPSSTEIRHLPFRCDLSWTSVALRQQKIDPSCSQCIQPRITVSAGGAAMTQAHLEKIVLSAVITT